MTITASVNYHVHRDDQQSFQFDVDGIAGNLMSPELKSVDVTVSDLRRARESVDFDQDGISFCHAPSAINRFDDSRSWQAIYDKEIKALLTKKIGAQDILVFDHTIRIDDGHAERKPARNVHNDYSEKGANLRLIDLVGEDKATQYRDGRFGFVNIWRPIEHPITSSPLGFIRPSSMSANDWMPIELIYPDRQGQILGVAANQSHEWFYLSNMTPDEAVIFNIYDNKARPFLAHSALDIAEQASNYAPRKSIETRTLVRYE